ncbi:MAG: hypothetical protein NTU41_04200 [Chloroflexi bacterium]|nr:hypothetical protein [Chloroflexota bacterium]
MNEQDSAFGYAGRILRADLSSGARTISPTSDYALRFLGGRGIAAKIYWDEVPPQARAFDPANALLFMTGPCAGIPALGGSRWQTCGKSPCTSPEHFSYGSFGGRWGAELKFTGHDGLVIQGNSEKPTYPVGEGCGQNQRNPQRRMGDGGQSGGHRACWREHG